MARRRKTGSGGGGAPWMQTFADLMNLLLCFFVVLFAFSTIDADKFAEIAASFNKSFSIFESGSAAIGEGKLISQGVSQLDQFSEYYNEMGLASEEGKEGDESGEAVENLEEYKEQLEKQQEQQVEELYQEIVEEAEKKQIDDTIQINVDDSNQYVRIAVSGAILFDTAEVEIKKDAKSVLNKIGDILKDYEQHLIKIEGHTDNIPISNAFYESNMSLSTQRAISVFNYLTEEKGLNPARLEASGRGEYNPVATNDTAEGRSKNRRVEIKIYTGE